MAYRYVCVQLRPYSRTWSSGWTSRKQKPDMNNDYNNIASNHNNKKKRTLRVCTSLYHSVVGGAVVSTIGRFWYRSRSNGISSHPCATRVLGAIGCNPWLAVYRYCGVPCISQQQTEKTRDSDKIYTAL